MDADSWSRPCRTRQTALSIPCTRRPSPHGAAGWGPWGAGSRARASARPTRRGGLRPLRVGLVSKGNPTASLLGGEERPHTGGLNARVDRLTDEEQAMTSATLGSLTGGVASR